MENRIADVALFVGLGLMFGALWWTQWVVPHDQARDQIIDCMHEQRDWSEAGWSRCRDRLAQEKKTR